MLPSGGNQQASARTADLRDALQLLDDAAGDLQDALRRDDDSDRGRIALAAARRAAAARNWGPFSRPSRR
jgi:hypothetical protein